MATSPPRPERPLRPYHSPRRRQQAERTTRGVVAAGHALLVEQGWAGTTMAQVAREAGISSAMLYKLFPTKAALAKRVYDVTLVGDEQDLPFRERPEFLAVAHEADPLRKLRGYAGLIRLVAERVLPIYRQLCAAVTTGAGDEQLREVVRTAEAERLFGARGIVADLEAVTRRSPGRERDRAVDLVWLAMSPELWSLLVDGRGWSWDQAEAWVADHLVATLL